MEWNSSTPSEWDWENLAMYGSKAVEIQLCSHETEGNVVDNGTKYSSGDGCFSGSDFGHGSLMKSSVSASVDSLSKEGTETFGGNEGFSENFSEKEEFSGVDKKKNFPTSIGASVGSGEPMIGLKLGRRTYFEDMCATSTTKTTSFGVTPTSSSATTKRSREFYQVAQSPRCQVQGCNLDLASAKDYHRRHRICQSHSKSPKVIVAGMERRFCQQCSRFHDLSEFDDKKRSCRRRLSDHNARRRRPQQEAIHFSSIGLSSSLYDPRPGMNFLLNRVPIPVSDRTWENDCNFKVTLARDSLVSPSKRGTIDRKPNFPSDTMPNAISTLHLDSDWVSPFHGITPRVLNRGLEASAITSTLDVAPELRHALSLLSSNSWGLNEPEPTSLEQLVHGNNASVAQRVMLSDPQNWALASSEYMRVEEAPSESQVHSLNLHNISSTQFHEFQLFRTPHESDCFYSNQIN